MHRERAETHVRLLAEAELRLSMPPLPAAEVKRHTPSVALAAQVLCTVGAVGIGAMDEIQYDLHFARAVRQPGPWLSRLTRYHRRGPQAPPSPGRSIATAAELPELDGTRLVILGLRHSDSDGATTLLLQASGGTPEDDWEYIRAVRPLPVLWIRDSHGRWHTTDTRGHHRVGALGEVILYPAITPPLAPGTPWVDVVAAGQSAEVRVRLPLRWDLKSRRPRTPRCE